MLMPLVRQDLIALKRDGAAWAVIAILVAALVLAVLNAQSVVAQHRTAVERHAADIWKAQAELKTPTAATQITRPVVLPDGPLAVLSLGRTRLDPAYGEASFWSRHDLLFRNYQVASPLALYAGAFDLGFVVLIVAPLLIIALGYGVLAGDRDGGRLRLLLSYPVRASIVLFARVGVRATAIALPTFLAVVVAGLLFGPLSPDGWVRLSLWLATALAYMAVWWSVVAFVSTLRLRAETVAAGLLALWALWVLVAPGVIAGTAAALHPPPSRAALIADLRRHEVAAQAKAPARLARFMHDHPQLQSPGKAYVADWMKTHAMVRIEAERHLAQPLAAFTKALNGQARIAAAAEFATPTLAANRILADAAGTGEARHRAFRDQAHAYKDHLQGQLLLAALGAREIGRPEADRYERFAFREERPAELLSRAAPPLAFWSLVAFGLFAVAAARAKRLAP